MSVKLINCHLNIEPEFGEGCIARSTNPASLGQNSVKLADCHISTCADSINARRMKITSSQNLKPDSVQ